MQAMVFTAPGVVEILDVERPEPAPGEVVVKVESSGICGSELHGISKPGFRQPPLVMGHEFAGTTADGRRVVVNPLVSCGECDLCQARRRQLCRVRSIIGIHRPGGFAQEVVVPEQMLHTLPDHLSWDQGAMVEPLANAVHAWNVAGAPTAARVGIIGAGTIGLVSLLVARRDAAEVVVTDLSQERRAMASELGADVVATELEGEFDVIIDAVGAGATHKASIDHLKPGGTTVWIGLLSPEAGFDAMDLIRSEKTIRGTFTYSNEEFARAIDLADEVDLSWATSFSLSQGADIFTQLMNGRSDVIKALLRP